MAILINKETRVLIQGITGGEGSRAAREMIAYGTRVVCGVTPGKGGETREGVPVFSSVKEALKQYPGIDLSLIAIPAQFVKDAARKAIAENIGTINILAEYVPPRDTAVIVAEAKRQGVRVIGPSSVGIISPGQAKIGSIGSGETKHVFTPGPIGIISKSGGMTAEISLSLSKAGLGQSTVVGIGGDIIAGTDYADLLGLFETDHETKAVVIFGEVGGSYEEDAADFIIEKQFTKPVVAIIGGKFAAKLGQGTVLGHAGAIVSEGKGSYESKIVSLTKAGVVIAETVEDIPGLVKAALQW